MQSDFAVEARELTKVYRTRWTGRKIQAVSALSLRVARGMKFGLLGANGAGKTTFVKMLLSAVHPTSGTAQIFGRDAQDAEARRPVGYLPENHRFPTYLTGAGMLDFYSALSGLGPADRQRRIPEMLSVVGLEQWGDVRIKKYSKGMLQRLGLAQALIHRPQLLVLDEPTDGVDPVGRRDIREILNRLTGAGVTVFLNSHLLSEVEAFCDYVAIVHRGRLALEGEMSSITSGRGYSVVCSPVPEAALLRLKSVDATVETHDATIEVRAPSRLQANQAIDILRAAGGEVESVTNRTSSLEEVFIELTAAKTAQERAA